MKIHLFIVLLIVISLALLPLACTSAITETSEATDTPFLLVPPPQEDLANNNFAHPEIPRILCEQLKEMMDKGDDFILVDTQENASFKYGYIPGAINIPVDESSPPFTQEWLIDQLKALPTNRMTIFYCP